MTPDITQTTALIEQSKSLPTWVQIVIVLTVTFSFLVLYIIRGRLDIKNKERQLDNDKKLGILLNLLYERYANNLTLDIAKSIIQMKYINTRYVIKDRVVSIIMDKSYYKDDVLLIDKLIEEITEFVNNEYYSDGMFLNKLNCKEIPLNVYHTEFRPNQFLNNIRCHLENIVIKMEEKDKDIICKLFTGHIKTVYDTTINKTFMKLEDLLQDKVKVTL